MKLSSNEARAAWARVTGVGGIVDPTVAGELSEATSVVGAGRGVPVWATLLALEVNGEITVGVDVKNVSTVAGAEVAQLYLHNTVASVSQPVRELKGFQRLMLQPAQSQHIEFKLGFDDLAFYNADVKRVVEPGSFDVFVGGSSQAEKAGSFTVLQ